MAMAKPGLRSIRRTACRRSKISPSKTDEAKRTRLSCIKCTLWAETRLASRHLFDHRLRIDPRCPTRWKIARKHRYAEHQQYCCKDTRRVRWSQPKHQRLQESSSELNDNEADRNANSYQPKGFLQEHSTNPGRYCSDCQSNPYFTSALCDAVRHNSINAQTRQEYGETAEQRKRPRQKALSLQPFLQMSELGCEVGWKLRIYRSHGFRCECLVSH